jgi:ADP-heptose:LPS heptosyltransferase
VDADPRNILVIHFGQLGDVVLGLPAMKAIRDRFPDARRTAVVGSATAEIVTMASLFNEVIPVDRVRLLKGNTLSSSVEIIRFALSIRRTGFDFVIDLHSLPETNLLGYFSGARQRLFSRRESRSLDRLSNFQPAPPVEDKSIHLSEYYLRVLQPLGVSGSPEPFRFKTSRVNVKSERPLVGLNPGAGHASRRWPLERFIELALMISSSGTADIAVFLGPEESAIADEVRGALNGNCSVVTGLTLNGLADRFARLTCLISNDTGPVHIAAASGTPIILFLENAAPDRYLPLTRHLTVHRGERLNDISVERVFDSVLGVLKALSTR